MATGMKSPVKTLVIYESIKSVLFETYTTLTISILDDKKAIAFDDNLISVRIYADEDRTVEAPDGTATITSLSDEMRLDANGKLTIMVVLHDIPKNKNRQHFVLKVSSSNHRVQPCYSTVFTCYKYRLMIENENDITNIWFKDENKQERFVDYKVVLLDSNGNVVKFQDLTLAVILYYEHGQLVPFPSILVISPDSYLGIAKSGRTNIRLRINDVSKNHQKQKFCLVFTAKKGFDSEFVAPAVSKAIEVRSKKSLKRSSDDVEYSAEGQDHVEHTHSVPATDESISGQTDLQTQFPITDSASNKRRSYTRVAPPVVVASTPAQPEVKEVHRLNPEDSMTNIRRWSSLVHEGLMKIRWNVAGYHPQPNGLPNFDSPIYTFSNPNVLLDRLCSIFVTRIVHDLENVYQRILDKDLPLLPNSPVRAHTGESAVYYILANCLYATVHSKDVLGLPAFSKSLRLLGFLSESTETSRGINPALIVFKDIAQVSLSHSERLSAVIAIQGAIDAEAPYVLSLGDKPSSTIDELKNDAFIYYWAHINDGFGANSATSSSPNNPHENEKKNVEPVQEWM